MKKGIIVEHQSRYTIVMDKHGVFHKTIPMKNKDIGMETFYQPKKNVWQSIGTFINEGLFTWKTIPMVLVCLLMVSPLYLWVSDNNEAYAVVSFDINPSLNITINKEYEVMEVEAINNDAARLLEHIDITDQTLATLTNKIVENVVGTKDKEVHRPILMAVSYFTDQHDKRLQEEMNDFYQEMGYHIAVYEVSDEFRSRAESEHVSMNELTAQAIEESDDNGVAQVSADSQPISSSLNNEDEEIIVNYYRNKEDNHQEQEIDSDQDNDVSQQDTPNSHPIVKHPVDGNSKKNQSVEKSAKQEQQPKEKKQTEDKRDQKEAKQSQKEQKKENKQERKEEKKEKKEKKQEKKEQRKEAKQIEKEQKKAIKQAEKEERKQNQAEKKKEKQQEKNEKKEQQKKKKEAK
ncbi:hypothetical protein SH601_06625 [Gracilibacillus sp. S3-1-1]|uniref:Uncharacterized protein n=1 Tax=Gracilibacillus pellucidus TaxID=3095368 RepID=A0ACC6M3W6_9BACI|nr:hypothetical protein [Gracilibacillus sp. S3-1-1]MDX8045660.1 hypothetical protein [Gracilibacillus sp. S3-1-1]